jgi:acetoin utilization protein AcuB
VQASDTMQRCLALGRKLGVAQFPVLDGERLVGIISANEIFQLAAHCLGAWERRSGVTLAPMRLGPGVLRRVVDAAESAGATVHALYPVGAAARADDDLPGPEISLALRFVGSTAESVREALQAAGLAVADTPHAVPAVAA